MDWQKIWDWYKCTIKLALDFIATALAIIITLGLIAVCMALVTQIITK